MKYKAETWNILISYLVSDSTVEWTLRHGRALTMSALFYDCSQKLLKLDIFNSLLELATTLSSNDRVRFSVIRRSCHSVLYEVFYSFFRFLFVKLRLSVWVMLLLVV